MVPTVSNKTRVPWNYSRLDKMQLSEHIPGLSPHMDAPKVLKSRLIGSGNGRGWFSRLCCPHQCDPRPQISRGGKLWYKKTRVSNLAARPITFLGYTLFFLNRIQPLIPYGYIYWPDLDGDIFPVPEKCLCLDFVGLGRRLGLLTTPTACSQPRLQKNMMPIAPMTPKHQIGCLGKPTWWQK